MLLCKTTILQTGLPPPTSIKKNFKRIVLTGITLCLILCVIFSFAACFFGGDDDADPATPGQTEPPSSDTDNPDNSNENDDDYWDDVIVPDDPVIDPDDPVIDPDDPVIDPDDPVIDPDPSDPTDPINPGDGDTSDFPKSIYECTTIEQIRQYYADEFDSVMYANYFDSVLSEIENFPSIDKVRINSITWRISAHGDSIDSMQVSFYYNLYSSALSLQIANITFDNKNVNDIINANSNPFVARAIISVGVTEEDEKNNTNLGKTVISTIDPDNTLEGDIWCSIGSISFSDGKEYRPITVYQITETGVEKYYMVVEAPSTNPESIIVNIQAGKYTTTSQSTEYTFTGMKIEQIPLPEEA